jgi:hypothetical protein
VVVDAEKKERERERKRKTLSGKKKEVCSKKLDGASIVRDVRCPCTAPVICPATDSL